MSTITRGSTATGRLVMGVPQFIRPVELTPPPVVITPITRAVWHLWFCFGPGTPALRTNGTLWISDKRDPQHFIYVGGKKVAVWTFGKPDSDIDSLNAEIARCTRQFNLPVAAYWTKRMQDSNGPLPVGATWIDVEAYKLKTETAAQYERRCDRAIVRCPRVMFTPNCYRSNPANTDDLAGVVPSVARLVNRHLNIEILSPFHDGPERDDGLQKYPEVLPFWKTATDQIKTPPLSTIPVLPVPEPPDPPDPPVPPMSTLTLRANNGQYVAVELDGTLTATRDVAASWETFTVESVDGGKFALKSAHGFYVCAEGGGGGPLIANRTAIGGWEKFKSVPSGIGIALETDNGHFWCAEDGGGREVNATRTVVGAWETFNGPQPIPDPVPGTGRTGQVRGEVFATADTGGTWLALGTSFFWGLWGWQNDRGRCLLNVQAAADANVDYLRVLGTVGPDEGWNDRAVDCSQPGWAEDARQFTDACWARGLRVQWSIFGSTSFAPTKGARRAAVEKLCLALAANPQAVFSIEIANEGWQNGFEGSAGVAELRELTTLARSLGPWVVATTAPNGDSCDVQGPYYKDSGCTFSTLHFARTSSGEGGDWRYVRQPWREGSRSCNGQTRLYSNNEPKELAGKGDWNVLRVVQSAVISWQCNVSSYVLHTGAGIRGGGAADLAVGRAANLWEVPGWATVTGALATARAILPTDLTNWSRGSSKPTMWDVSSWEAVGRVYSSTQGRQFCSTPHNISKPLTLTATQPLSYTTYHPVDWSVLSSATLNAGDRVVFSGTPPAVVILGTLS